MRLLDNSWASLLGRPSGGLGNRRVGLAPQETRHSLTGPSRTRQIGLALPQSYHGRLELTWTNKDECLLAREDGSYEWVARTDYRVAEVRLLRTAGAVGAIGGHENLLIRGDALSALTALQQIPDYADHYVGRVQLAYLDPPFNTQQSFLQYDDALGHSVWLTMLRDRLVQIRALLATTGSVWVHLDDYEAAHCRIVLDEIFGRENYVSTVIWKRRNDPRNMARHVSGDHDTILVYAKSLPDLRTNRLDRTEAMDAAYANPDGDPRGPWRRSDLAARNPYSKGLYGITTPSGRIIEGPPSGSYWRVAQEELERLDADDRIYWGEDGASRPYLKRYLTDVNAGRVPGSVWQPEEVGFVRNGKEEVRAAVGDVFATPKPERLMQRIVHIASNPGDIVLDCFLGSGTTAAVAHKMGRRWVGVERSEDTVDAFTIPRLTRVCEGDDPGGITQSVGWTGGEGFRILDVGPSMFEEDDGVVVLADWAVNTELAEATAAQLGFRYEVASPFCGRKGRSRLAVIDGLVSDTVIELLVGALGNGELLTICGTSVDSAAAERLRELRRGSRVRKIPASLLTEYQDATRWQPRLLPEPGTVPDEDVEPDAAVGG
jgi:adenine-specific DNA-methyltransferase